MSLEAWGDENPNTATRWEDTVMRKDFDAIADRFEKWLRDNSDELTSEMQATAGGIEALLVELTHDMQGEI